MKLTIKRLSQSAQESKSSRAARAAGTSKPSAPVTKSYMYEIVNSQGLDLSKYAMIYTLADGRNALYSFLRIGAHNEVVTVECFERAVTTQKGPATTLNLIKPVKVWVDQMNDILADLDDEEMASAFKAQTATRLADSLSIDAPVRKLGASSTNGSTGSQGAGSQQGANAGAGAAAGGSQDPTGPKGKKGPEPVMPDVAKYDMNDAQQAAQYDADVIEYEAKLAEWEAA